MTLSEWPRRLPVQAGYAAKPWWKYEHLARVNRVVMPVYRHYYPIGADTMAPADIGALARWMQRWGLLPGRLALDVARKRLEALASAPVQMIDPQGVAPQGCGTPLRLPAEWEPSEAVIITWPVLFPGLWRFHRDLARAIAPVGRVDVLIPDSIFAPAVLYYLGMDWPDDKRLRLLVTAVDDIWVRDYGPLTCLDPAGRRVMVDAIFDPPPAMPFANDDALPVRYAAHHGLVSRHLPLHLEGGNLWSDGQGTLIATEGLFARNPLLTRDEVRRQLLVGLGAAKLIVVPCLHLEETGHVDVFAKLATPDTVLVTEPRIASNERRLAEVVAALSSSTSAAGTSYRVETLPSVPVYRNWGVSRIWPSYTNALTVNGRVLVPTYGLAGRDAAALAIYQRVLPAYEIIGIDSRIAANSGGTVHCLTMQVPARPAQLPGRDAACHSRFIYLSTDQFEIDLQSAIGFGRPAVPSGEGDPVFGRGSGHECVIDGATCDAKLRESGVESFRTLSAEESRAGEVVREQPCDRARGAAVGRWHPGQHRERLERRMAAETAAATSDSLPRRLVVLVTRRHQGYGDAGVYQELWTITAGRHREASVQTRR